MGRGMLLNARLLFCAVKPCLFRLCECCRWMYMANTQVTQGRLEEAMASLHKLRDTGGT